MRRLAAIVLSCSFLFTAPSRAQAVAELADLEIAAWKGDPGAQTELAMRYEHGEGVERNLERAHALYCSAARQGHAEAKYRFGWIYANARGVPRDDAVAAELFERAASVGHAQAGALLKVVRPRPETLLPICLKPEPELRLKLDFGAMLRTAN